MPAYNFRDTKAPDELDPCIAAEIRTKNENDHRRRNRFIILISVLITLLTLVAIAVAVYLSQTSHDDSQFARGPWIKEDTTEKTPKMDNEFIPDYDDEGPANRAYGHPLVSGESPTDKFDGKFVPMTPVDNSKEKQTLKPDVENGLLPKPTAASESVKFRSTPKFIPVNIRPAITTTPTIPEVSTYSTKSDEVLDFIPSFSSIDDRKYDFIETDDVLEDCDQYKKAGHKKSGVYEIKVRNMQFRALCLMETDYAWMVLQRRSGNAVSFNKTFEEYANGFGNPTQDHWLGLEKVHAYSERGRLLMRIELRGDSCGEPSGCSGTGSSGYWWGDWNFGLGPKKSGYKLSLETIVRGNLSEPSSDEFHRMNNDQSFTTIDVDNDASKGIQCAKFKKLGAWWHRDCSLVALNGEYGDKTTKPRSMHWLFQRSAGSSIISYAIKPEKSLIKFRIKP
uniref:Fibrinogen C-terminal domain-containing protein n=1 Tax=Panagrolaimus sp. JU765 TaxID=591449 RepID=A0AC34QQN7_9BILA